MGSPRIPPQDFGDANGSSKEANSFWSPKVELKMSETEHLRKEARGGYIRGYLALVRERSDEMEVYCKTWPFRESKHFSKQAFTLDSEMTKHTNEYTMQHHRFAALDTICFHWYILINRSIKKRRNHVTHRVDHRDRPSARGGVLLCHRPLTVRRVAGGCRERRQRGRWSARRRLEVHHYSPDRS